MKKLLFFLIFFSIAYSSFSQKIKITGNVIDQVSKASIPYVTITCKDNNQKVIGGSLTNDKGKFTITKLPLKKLFITFQFIGYKEYTREINPKTTSSAINLGVIVLQENTTLLNEVQIQAENSTFVQKIDRKIFNVGKDLTSAGTNSLEMLQNLPSVDVNQLNGSVSLRGNDNVKVLINGKPSNTDTQQLLKQIPSNSVKRIEIITNPSAKYNPEGMSGIINIILKKNTKIGFNGNFSIGVEHSKNTRPDVSLSTNYKTGNTNFYGSYYGSWGDYKTINSFQRTDKNIFQNLDFLDNSRNHNFKIGVDFTLSEKSFLSFYTDQSINNTDLTSNVFVTENSNPLFNNNGFSTYNNKEHSYNLDYIYNFDDKGQNLEIELNRSITKNPEATNNKELVNPNSNLYNYTTNNQDTRKLWLVNIDYTKPLKSGSLELGLEYRNQELYNFIDTDRERLSTNLITSEPVGNTNLKYNRNIYSAYINLNKEYKKISFQAGLRFEQFNLDALFSNTQQGNTPLKDKQFNIYPSAFVTYQLSNKDDIQISYSRRVDRPSTHQITPILEWFSPLSISKGNLNLIPQFTNSVELNYTRTLTKGYISFGTFYRRTNQKIGRFIEKDNLFPDRQIISFINYDFSDSYGFEFSGRYKATKWWTIYPSFETYIQDSEGILNNQETSIKNTLVKSGIRNSFKASKKLRFSLTATYRGKSKNILYTVDPYTMVNFGASLSVLKSKGRISLRATDIFNNLNFDYFSSNPFPQKGKYDLEYNSIYLGFSYSFGSGKNKAKERKYRDDNETQGSMF